MVVADAAGASIGAFATHVGQQFQEVMDEVSKLRFEATQAGAQAERALASAGAATTTATEAASQAATAARGTSELR